MAGDLVLQGPCSSCQRWRIMQVPQGTGTPATQLRSIPPRPPPVSDRGLNGVLCRRVPPIQQPHASPRSPHLDGRSLTLDAHPRRGPRHSRRAPAPRPSQPCSKVASTLTPSSTLAGLRSTASTPGSVLRESTHLQFGRRDARAISFSATPSASASRFPEEVVRRGDAHPREHARPRPLRSATRRRRYAACMSQRRSCHPLVPSQRDRWAPPATWRRCATSRSPSHATPTTPTWAGKYSRTVKPSLPPRHCEP